MGKGETQKGLPARPDIVYRDGKPSAVILDIAQYEELLERLEDLEDLKELGRIREEPQSYRSLDEILREKKPRV